jgi:Cys/Met metabolism PLP-dependent enzyme
MPLRGRRHSDNALAVAEFLQESPRPEWTSYSGLRSHPQHANRREHSGAAHAGAARRGRCHARFGAALSGARGLGGPLHGFDQGRSWCPPGRRSRRQAPGREGARRRWLLTRR